MPSGNAEKQTRSEKITVSRTVSPPTASGSSSSISSVFHYMPPDLKHIPGQIPDSFDIFAFQFKEEQENPPNLLKSHRSNEESDIASTAIRVLDTKRFAYVSSTTSKRQKLPKAPLSARSRDNTSIPPLATNKATAFNLSNDELSNVFRCVCCEISWTVKKTGPQKLTHIRSCAKKHALKEETVRILLQKEVASFVPSLKSLGKTKAKEPLPEAGPSSKKTFLEEIVGDEPRKRTKRWQVETTLASVSTTRDSILSRAQGILNPTSSLPELDGSAIIVDQPFQPSSLIDALDGDISPLTQPFARSTLAHLHGTKISLFNMNTSPVRVKSTTVDISHRRVYTTSPEPTGVSPPPLEPIITSRPLEEVWEIGQTGQPDKYVS